MAEWQGLGKVGGSLCSGGELMGGGGLNEGGLLMKRGLMRGGVNEQGD